MRLLPCSWGGQPEGKIRLAVMAGESIYANVRLRLTANRTYELLACWWKVRFMQLGGKIVNFNMLNMININKVLEISA